MCGMNAPPFRRAVSIALLLAMAYGLGAAPCGCWEHSGWRAAAALFAVEPSEPQADGDRLLDDECHEHATNIALLTSRPRIEKLATALTAIEFQAHELIGAAELVVAAFDDPAVLALAPPVRAELQVFRL